MSGYGHRGSQSCQCHSRRAHARPCDHDLVTSCGERLVVYVSPMRLYSVRSLFGSALLRIRTPIVVSFTSLYRAITEVLLQYINHFVYKNISSCSTLDHCARFFRKRHPQTNLPNADMFWDFMSLTPESMHQVLYREFDTRVNASGTVPNAWRLLVILAYSRHCASHASYFC